MERVCEGTPWGPWSKGNLSLCFQEIVVFGLHSLALFILGTMRIRKLLTLPEAGALPRSRLFEFVIVLNLLCGIFPVAHILINFALGDLRIYETFSDGFVAISWCLAVLILKMERDRGVPSNWVLRVWYLFAYVFGAIKLQALIDLDRDEHGDWGWDFYLYALNFLMFAALAIISLFVRQPAHEASGPAYRPVLSSSPEPAVVREEGRILPTVLVENPYEHANWFSRLTFSWLSPLMARGYEHPLEDADLYPLPKDDVAAENSERFRMNWHSEKTAATPSLFRALWKAFGWYFVLAGLIKLGTDALMFLGPIMLRKLISFVSNPGQPLWHGVMYAVVLLVTSTAQSLFLHVYFFMVFRTGMRIRAGLVTAIYRKSLKLSSKARQQSTVGEITNLMAVDTQKFVDLVSYLHTIWSGPEQIIVSLYLLWQLVGVSVFGGVAVMVLLIPVNTYLARKQGALQKTMMTIKDQRVKAVNEALQGMRIIKFFAWEESFRSKIEGIRERELSNLKSGSYLRVAMMYLWSASPVLISASTFTLFALLGNTLTAESIFTALALFNIMRFPMNMFPQVISNLVETKIAGERIQRYLLSEQLNTKSIVRSENPDYAIEIDEADFRWSNDDERPTLTNITLKIPHTQLVAVVGPVGSGKSSLISALLGNMYKCRGHVALAGTVAYCSQQAWMMNASLRDNITFGKPFDKSRYDEVVRACQLLPDIAMLPAGDETEIGEKGINLSGGQKQRVSLARAVYQDADIYILDDPLSAVDAHVGKDIFQQCVCGALREKTRVLVTHQLQYLHVADKIVVMKGGRVGEVGSYKELMEAGLDFASLISAHVTGAAASSSSNASLIPSNSSASSNNVDKPTGADAAKGKEKAPASSVPADKPAKKPPGKSIIVAETRDVGGVNVKVYWQYLAALGGVSVVVILALGFVLDQATKVGGDWWLSHWSNVLATAPYGTHVSTAKYLLLYLLFNLLNGVAVLGRTLALALGSIRASRVLHSEMLKRTLRSPMSFFDTTPVGRIINRFSKDTNSLDESVARAASMLIVTVLAVFGAVVVISWVTPFFLVVALPMAWLYQWIQRYYLESTREMQRLDSISKSPIFAHFTETLNGATTIRAYGVQPTFKLENDRKLDHNQRAYCCIVAANRWLGVRLEFIGTVVVFLAALFSVIQRESIDPGLAGLSITYALNVTGTLNWLVRMSTEAETQFVAVERVLEYTRLETEADPIVPWNRPKADWPPKGEIELKDLALRYRAGLDLVLHGLSCTIHAQEKVGIVGRTGAGKSSLVLALFRLVEPARGQVMIDAVDIGSIGLDDLRSRLAIIPQDPVLFEGTVRSNLDPFNQYSDSDLWDSLRSVHLYDYVQSTALKLEHPISENGENLSVGQRQLMCLGRALLRKSRVLVMDEATAAVDYETDALIQKTIRSEFQDRTVITIAHRINTIIDYDRVMVLDKGRIAEFDKPSVLLANPGSIFYSLVQSSQQSMAVGH